MKIIRILLKYSLLAAM